MIPIFNPHHYPQSQSYSLDNLTLVKELLYMNYNLPQVMQPGEFSATELFTVECLEHLNCLL